MAEEVTGGVVVELHIEVRLVEQHVRAAKPSLPGEPLAHARGAELNEE